MLVVSTGSPDDYRNPDHYRSLCARVTELGIDDAFVRLGVVPYRDLLALMRHALAIINPSLFEGWSTTVEEARALGKRVLLSDIPTHREQSPAHAVFFDPRDPAGLAGLMGGTWDDETREPVVAPDAEHAHAARRIAFSRRYHEILGGVFHA
jgi:glycosyltransferase involved in cell wall biosynthesis